VHGSPIPFGKEKRKTMKVVLVGALLLALSAGMAAAQIVITCSKGGPERCNGSSGNDRITGSSRSDDIYARSGHDLVDARGGRDLVLGGADGDDPNFGGGLEGGAGNDTVKGQDGDDTVKDEASGDEDRLFGDDFVDGRDGDRRDILDCGSGRDAFARDNGDEVKKNCERPF
jgi:Ca2+-binding RTX toxin-like protein